MRLINYTVFSAAVLVAMIASPAAAKRKAVEVATTATSAATIMSYKRDPLPIYDNSGSKLRDVGAFHGLSG